MFACLRIDLIAGYLRRVCVLVGFVNIEQWILDCLWLIEIKYLFRACYYRRSYFSTPRYNTS